MKPLNAIRMAGREILPLIEGGKGISVTNGRSAGAWAFAGGVGTFSGVNADSLDARGRIIPQVYSGRTRAERHEELVRYAIDGGVAQAQIAHEERRGEGRLHVNILWEMGGARRVLEGILARAKGLIHGVTCGAGMPYKLSEIAARFGVYYYPIVSSARAFRVLFKRSYHRNPEWLGGVVYEDPWLAGGHTGLSNAEDPKQPEPPYPRVSALRREMSAVGLVDTPIIIAGGVWYLRDWADWIDNPELGPVAFQFGTRPLLTTESPISPQWKKRLLTLKAGDVGLHRHSPTGFYSSAVRNKFLEELDERSRRQVPFAYGPEGELTEAVEVGARKRRAWMAPVDGVRAREWMAAGYTEGLRTPAQTMVFVTPERARTIRQDQTECMGCLSQCLFSNWADNEDHRTGRKADPRSFCIQKTLQEIAHDSDVDTQLMFAGHNAWRFAEDPFYKGGFIPTVRQLVARLQTGD